jgi:hypothetical protein
MWLQIPLVILDKLHKILLAKTLCGIKSKRESHEGVIYTKFSSNLCGMIIYD